MRSKAKSGVITKSIASFFVQTGLIGSGILCLVSLVLVWGLNSAVFKVPSLKLLTGTTTWMLFSQQYSMTSEVFISSFDWMGKKQWMHWGLYSLISSMLFLRSCDESFLNWETDNSCRFLAYSFLIMSFFKILILLVYFYPNRYCYLST